MALTVALWFAGAGNAQAFTIIPPVAKLYVNPKAGYTTSVVQVRGTATVNNTCTGTQLSFNFFFDGTALWNRSVSTCTANTWDTGWSPYRTPAVPRTVGKHTITLNLVNPANGAVVATASYVYSIYQAPASPQTQPSPSTQPSPTTSPSADTSPSCPPGAVKAGCPSPSAAACPAAMLPPPGTGGWADDLIAGAMVVAVIPVAGLALFGPGPLWAAVSRRRRLLMLLGLSAVAAFTLNCTFPTNSTQPVANVSPSASPSSCSA